MRQRYKIKCQVGLNLRLKFFFTKVMHRLKKSVFLHPEIFGEMAEWSKARAWRARKRQKRFMGSNPILSAET